MRNGTEFPVDLVAYSYIVSSLLVSSIFPLATFVIYAVLPQLHNVHGLSTMCYITTIFTTYMLDGILHIFSLENQNKDHLCVAHVSAVYAVQWLHNIKLNSLQITVWVKTVTITMANATVIHTELLGNIYFYSRLASSSLFASSIFPLANFVIYAVLPELHNAHGLSIMCYIATIFANYILDGMLLVKISLQNQEKDHLCITHGVILYYFALCIYSWMGVLCFDTFWTFTYGSSEDKETWSRVIQVVRPSITMRSVEDSPSVGSAETSNSTRANGVRDGRAQLRRRFLLYSALGWGLPLIIVAIGQILEYVEGFLDWVIVPGFGADICWFTTDTATLAYLSLPSLLILIFSLVLLLRTRCRFHLVNEVYRTNAASRMRAVVCALSILGIIWVCETITNMSFPIWAVISILYVVQAVLLFVVFVCQGHVLRLLYRRCLPFLKAWRRRVPASMGCYCCDRYAELPSEQPSGSIPNLY